MCTDAFVKLPLKSTEVNCVFLPRSHDGDEERAQLLVALDRQGDGDDVPAGFIWNGASVPWLLRRVFPKWRHPKATCGHDFDCGRARNKEERKSADMRFRRRVEATGTKRAKVEAFIGYYGVRVGALVGYGSNF